MSKSTSALLDLFRFIAAMLVFFYHSDHLFHSAWLSPLASFGHDSVVFFFMLSGFVIAYTTQKPHTLRDYAVARLARMYSVALPSLLLVVVLYGAGRALHTSGTESIPVDQWARSLAASALFIGQSLDPRLSLPTNAAYWSVCFEVWYYVLFGCAFYLRGMWRIALLALAGWAAGLSILLMFPIWLLGYWFFHVHTRWQPGRAMAAAMLLAAPALYLIMRALNLDDRFYDFYAGLFGGDEVLNARLGFGKHFLADYVTAALLLVFMTGALALGDLALPWLTRYRRQIDFAAGGSFSLYLYHMPLLAFLASIYPSSVPVMAAALVIIYLLAELTEKRKAPYVRLFRQLLPAPRRVLS